MALTIEAYLNRWGSQPDIRRFGVPPDVISLSSVKQKVAEVFPSLNNKPFSLQWTDQEGNLVTFSSDQELQEAISTVTDGVLLVHVITDQEGDRVTFSSDEELQAAVSTVTDGVQRIHVDSADTVDRVPGCQTDAKEVTEGQKRNSNILVSPSAESEQPIIDVTSRSEDVAQIKDQKVTSPTTSEDSTLLTPAERRITTCDDGQSETHYPNINGETQPGYPKFADDFYHYHESDNDDHNDDNNELDDDSDDDNDDDNSLNVVSLNVCGLDKRLRSLEFINFQQDKDIICLQETKTNTKDDPQINGFTLYLKHRIDSLIRSGGMGIAVKNTYAKYITPLDDECKYILWIQINKDLFGMDQDIYLGNVYIPPKGSPYANGNMFHEVEQSIRKALLLSEFVVIMGDFNARTNNICDYKRINYNDSLRPEAFLDNLNLPRVRTTQDNVKTNSHGRKLINICQKFTLFICNGRIGQDRMIGKTTCNGKSVIDYIIASPLSLHLVSDLSIMDFFSSLSDVHCPVTCTLGLM